MISLGFIYGFFWDHLGLHAGFLIRVSLRFLWVSPMVSLGFHLGYKQNRIKQKKVNKQRDSKDRKQRSKGAGSRAAKTHD